MERMERTKKGLIQIDEPKRIDWNAVRAEYIGGGISQRKLAAKYGISVGTLLRRANVEGWAENRERIYNNGVMAIEREITKTVADNATIAANIKRKGLLLIERILDEYTHNSTEHRENKQGVTDIKRLRDLTAAYKDLTGDIQTTNSAASELLQSLLELERKP